VTITSLHTKTIISQPTAYYDAIAAAVVITDVMITDPSVVAEAMHWSSGQRGAACEPVGLAGVDLSPFVRQALNIGVQAIALAGGAQDKFELKQLINDVGERTSRAAADAASSTATLVDEATLAIRQASTDASKAVGEAGKLARAEFADSVKMAQVGLQDELRRLFGDDDPELQRRLNMVLEGFGQRVTQASAEKTEALFAKAARQFDPDEPTSPMARQICLLDKQQTELKANIDQKLGELGTQYEKLTAVVERTQAAKDARHAVEQGTTLKGATYEERVNAAMRDIADGLGDDYEATGSQPGKKGSSKKGDGVLRVQGGDAAVVVEMSDSLRRTWPDYLAAAEATRGAQASLGLVPNASLLQGSSVRCLGARRIVMAFDPETGDPELLRTVVQLLRIAAVAATSRVGNIGVRTADEKLNEALSTIERFDKIQRSANLIRQHANTIDVEAGSLQDLLQRILTEARTALAAATHAVNSDDSESLVRSS
jgi:hypothetical protein